MSLIALCSAHGAPGVTTTALALAGVWAGERVLVAEADPAGGVAAARFGLKDAPGLVSLAAEARRGLDTEMVWRHSQDLPGGLSILVAPPSADQAHAVLRDIAGGLADWCRGEATVDVIADCGRLMPGSPILELLRDADMVLLVTRPSADQLRPAAHRVRSLDVTGAAGRLLLVGDRPYGAEEVASTLGVEVAGTIAWDPDAARALCGETGGGDLRRSRLVRSVASLAETLDLAPSPAGTEFPDRMPIGAEVEVGEEVSP